MWLILVFLGGKYLLFSLFILVAPFALHFEVPFIGGSQFYWKKKKQASGDCSVGKVSAGQASRNM